jgi:hypothetical protein
MSHYYKFHSHTYINWAGYRKNIFGKLVPYEQRMYQHLEVVAKSPEAAERMIEESLINRIALARLQLQTNVNENPRRGGLRVDGYTREENEYFFSWKFRRFISDITYGLQKPYLVTDYFRANHKEALDDLTFEQYTEMFGD